MDEQEIYPPNTEVLDLLIRLDIDTEKFVSDMLAFGYSEETTRSFIVGLVRVDQELAKTLASYFNTDPSHWMEIQDDWDWLVKKYRDQN